MLVVIDCLNCGEVIFLEKTKSNCYFCKRCGKEFFYEELGFYHMNEDKVPDYVFANVTFISF